ncbi:MAG: chemotaxis protein CheC [Elusimicrobia bacterium]|nr:chemotaxis protein CheC [Patescibacteria group bacterium]MBU4455566.1 chemotaxis protein CheC [Patescibacteria group bacterium]MCG2724847.1 chemotaxis protein CheC [Elusimicrobiota bacterium]
METKNQLTKEGIAAFEKMAHEGAKKASVSLSKLINQETEVMALAVRTLPVEKIPEIVGSPEDMVTTVIMEIKGDVNGSLALVYPQKSALNIADLLAKREIGSTAQLAELDKSALKESGNIIAGSFLAAISDYLTINMVESIPDIATNMLKATIDFMLAGFIKKGVSDTVAFEIDFGMGTTTTTATEKIKAYFVLLLDTESAAKVLGSLKKISGGRDMAE